MNIKVSLLVIGLFVSSWPFPLYFMPESKRPVSVMASRDGAFGVLAKNDRDDRQENVRRLVYVGFPLLLLGATVFSVRTMLTSLVGSCCGFFALTTWTLVWHLTTHVPGCTSVGSGLFLNMVAAGTLAFAGTVETGVLLKLRLMEGMSDQSPNISPASY